MTKKLTAPRLPDNPTEEEKEAFRLSVTESINNFADFTPEDINRFLAGVLRQLIANGMKPILPEGITTEPMLPSAMENLEKMLKRKGGVVRVKDGIARIVVKEPEER